MTTHRIQCLHASDDVITVTSSEDSNVVFYPGTADSVYASPADARTFARGILALADEADGGEVSPSEPAAAVKIGDVVNIVRPEGCCDPEYRGRVGVLTDVDNTACKYRVRVDGAERDIVWAYEVAPVEQTNGASQMPAVGDRVRVLTDDASNAEVAAGDVFTVTSLNLSDFNTDAGWYFRPEDVEILSADEPTAVAITRPTREAYLHRAAELLGINPSASDLIELADYLAGEGA